MNNKENVVKQDETTTKPVKSAKIRDVKIINIKNSLGKPFYVECEDLKIFVETKDITKIEIPNEKAELLRKTLNHFRKLGYIEYI